MGLTDEDGVTGYGEAAPLEPYDGVGLERVREALERYRPVLARTRRAAAAPQLLDACRAGRGPAGRHWPRSTWRCGTSRAGARDGRWRRC